ncbi:hypothetical protein VOLCADRAFT_120451 [Volvox carteri f. nagariensis]|uniref:procollagen-proline 4-dioxygenase n=1 Tax=Volvox carteri f. nagariensis TaxID=3068 RepID=D8TLQ5_VOLCA|nr:uncharacterized protein VOLCADRAFT_120451 [Volvox carteri f. nagariensis]EFJ51369.1 hypothetical protein VOLCADRAFT_120451 [Volvox carteri f. nagariensis]|eukprot:XP_002947321.1 hypothetical protein VOLCADRAFT_120451 [Volvox carteri f. nagariensis]
MAIGALRIPVRIADSYVRPGDEQRLFPNVPEYLCLEDILSAWPRGLITHEKFLHKGTFWRLMKRPMANGNSVYMAVIDDPGSANGNGAANGHLSARCTTPDSSAHRLRSMPVDGFSPVHDGSASDLVGTDYISDVPAQRSQYHRGPLSAQHSFHHAPSAPAPLSSHGSAQHQLQQRNGDLVLQPYHSSGPAGLRERNTSYNSMAIVPSQPSGGISPSQLTPGSFSLGCGGNGFMTDLLAATESPMPLDRFKAFVRLFSTLGRMREALRLPATTPRAAAEDVADPAWESPEAQDLVRQLLMTRCETNDLLFNQLIKHVGQEPAAGGAVVFNNSNVTANPTNHMLAAPRTFVNTVSNAWSKADVKRRTQLGALGGVAVVALWVLKRKLFGGGGGGGGGGRGRYGRPDDSEWGGGGSGRRIRYSSSPNPISADSSGAPSSGDPLKVSSRPYSSSRQPGAPASWRSAWCGLLAGWGPGPSRQGLGQKRDRYGPEPWIETISWSPRAFVYHNFLTSAECDHLVQIGTQRVSRSLVVDSQTGQSKLDDIRTSYGAAFGRGEDPVIAEIEERIAEWTHLPPEHGEPMQILRYVDGQKYDAHWDWFDDPVHHRSYLVDGNRYATVLLYLSEVEAGGETNLPLADPIDMSVQAIENPSPCAAKMGLSIRPRKGDALLFYDMDIEGQKGDRKALHASCPTLKGMKWTATKWIHSKPYMGRFDPLRTAGVCRDTAQDCAALVAEGRCTSDLDTMVGPAGKCRKSCGDCVDCPNGDILCARRNMRSLVLAKLNAAKGKSSSSSSGGGAP